MGERYGLGIFFALGLIALCAIAYIARSEGATEQKAPAVKVERKAHVSRAIVYSENFGVEFIQAREDLIKELHGQHGCQMSYFWGEVEMDTQNVHTFTLHLECLKFFD